MKTAKKKTPRRLYFCKFPECTKQDAGSGFCARHGGGTRCSVLGCTKTAQGKNKLCKAHGAGSYCSTPGCNNKSVARGVCIRHGGGKRCRSPGCSKSARTGCNLCTAHLKQSLRNEESNSGKLEVVRKKVINSVENIDGVRNLLPSRQVPKPSLKPSVGGAGMVYEQKCKDKIQSLKQQYSNTLDAVLIQYTSIGKQVVNPEYRITALDELKSQLVSLTGNLIQLIDYEKKEQIEQTLKAKRRKLETMSLSSPASQLQLRDYLPEETITFGSQLHLLSSSPTLFPYLSNLQNLADKKNTDSKEKVSKQKLSTFNFQETEKENSIGNFSNLFPTIPKQ
eukprot:snap_masked-scaffold_6-processed-gene-9.20-mRNA-1 protein AED:0.61 eAED:0.61 QI:0/-1/0/1/-1/1/1/0/336